MREFTLGRPTSPLDVPVPSAHASAPRSSWDLVRASLLMVRLNSEGKGFTLLPSVRANVIWYGRSSDAPRVLPDCFRPTRNVGESPEG